jgi:hypothetical protein
MIYIIISANHYEITTSTTTRVISKADMLDEQISDTLGWTARFVI